VGDPLEQVFVRRIIFEHLKAFFDRLPRGVAATVKPLVPVIATNLQSKRAEAMLLRRVPLTLRVSVSPKRMQILTVMLETTNLRFSGQLTKSLSLDSPIHRFRS
jgi:hypothetical protein